MDELPYLSLSQVDVDPVLVRLVPRKLAYYHLVLPLAADGGQVSVAMTHTDNPVILNTLATLLGAEIVPVFSSAAEIRAVLDQVWALVTRPDPIILTWGSTAQRAQLARTTGEALGEVFAARVTDLWGEDLQTLLMLAQQDTYTLTIISVSPTYNTTSAEHANHASHSDINNHGNVAAAVREATTPVLLLYGDEPKPFGRILLSLRGRAPDLSALDWVIPLAKVYQAETTVLAVTANPPSGNRQGPRTSHSLTILLDPANEPAQHLAECTERLVEAGIPGYLKLCQGDPTQQIAAEFIKGQYALLVIISEAHGEFVQGVIDAISAVRRHYAVLVVKPAITG